MSAEATLPGCPCNPELCRSSRAGLLPNAALLCRHLSSGAPCHLATQAASWGGQSEALRGPILLAASLPSQLWAPRRLRNTSPNPALPRDSP